MSFRVLLASALWQSSKYTPRACKSKVSSRAPCASQHDHAGDGPWRTRHHTSHTIKISLSPYCSIKSEGSPRRPRPCRVLPRVGVSAPQSKIVYRILPSRKQRTCHPLINVCEDGPGDDSHGGTYDRNVDMRAVSARSVRMSHAPASLITHLSCM